MQRSWWSWQWDTFIDYKWCHGVAPHLMEMQLCFPLYWNVCAIMWGYIQGKMNLLVFWSKKKSGTWFVYDMNQGEALSLNVCCWLFFIHQKLTLKDTFNQWLCNISVTNFGLIVFKLTMHSIWSTLLTWKYPAAGPWWNTGSHIFTSVSFSAFRQMSFTVY